jgi:hypothetical protein
MSNFWKDPQQWRNFGSDLMRRFRSKSAPAQKSGLDIAALEDRVLFNAVVAPTDVSPDAGAAFANEGNGLRLAEETGANVQVIRSPSLRPSESPATGTERTSSRRACATPFRSSYQVHLVQRQPKHTTMNIVDYFASQHEHDEREQEQQDSENPAAN